MTWPLVKLGEVASEVHRPIAVEIGQSYRTIGVRWWGEGAYERQTIDGSATAAKTLSLVRESDLIINKIWVRHGSIAIAGEEVDGCAASNEFPTFQLDPKKVHPRWLHWLSKTQWFWTCCDRLSMGTSGKNRIKPERFLTIEIPLPPLAEQRRLVARIDALAAKIEEAKRLRETADQSLEELCRSFFRESKDNPLTPTAMSDLVWMRETDVTVLNNEYYHFAGVYCFGRGVFVGQRKSGMEFKYPRLTRLRAGNFVYPKLMAWEGALGIVPEECDGLVVSTEFPVFEIDTTKVLPEVLDTYFRTPNVWPELSGTSTGTNMRRQRLNPADFLKYRFPLPPMDAQLQLREIRHKTNAIRIFRLSCESQLNALLPAILDRAFRGEM